MNKAPTLASVVKLAAIREAGHPVGQPAPCYFKCTCGTKIPAFSGDQTCSCGKGWDNDGWRIA